MKIAGRVLWGGYLGEEGLSAEVTENGVFWGHFGATQGSPGKELSSLQTALNRPVFSNGKQPVGQTGANGRFSKKLPKKTAETGRSAGESRGWIGPGWCFLGGRSLMGGRTCVRSSMAGGFWRRSGSGREGTRRCRPAYPGSGSGSSHRR